MNTPGKIVEGESCGSAEVVVGSLRGEISNFLLLFLPEGPETERHSAMGKIRHISPCRLHRKSAAQLLELLAVTEPQTPDPRPPSSLQD